MNVDRTKESVFFEKHSAKEKRSVKTDEDIFQCYALSKTLDQTQYNMSMLPWLEGDSSLPKVNKKFLVVVHLTQDSLGNPPLNAAEITKAKSDISAASGYYSAIKMSFEASDTVYQIENNRFDIIETEAELTEMYQLYAKENRINLFIINRYGGELEGGCGIAGDHTMTLASGCLNPGSLGHEIGHIFGLAHTFGGGSVVGDNFNTSDEFVDGSNCTTAGDGICDTPADPYIPNDTTGIVWIRDCAFVYDGKDDNGDFYDPDIANLMSYYFEGSCGCPISLSGDQLRKVADTYLSSGSRYSWW